MSNQNASLAIPFADVSGSSRLYEPPGDIELRNGKLNLSDRSTNGTCEFIADGRNTLLHREESPLSGSGLISLGHDTAGDPASPLTIRFSCE